MPPARVLVPLTLVVGEEDLLVGRAVSAVVQAARALDPQVDVRDLQGAEVRRRRPARAAEPVAVRRPARARRPRRAGPRAGRRAELTAYAGDPLDEVSVVVCHAGGQKGKPLLKAFEAAGARRVEAPKMAKVGDRKAFLRTELRVDRPAGDRGRGDRAARRRRQRPARAGVRGRAAARRHDRPDRRGGRGALPPRPRRPHRLHRRRPRRRGRPGRGARAHPLRPGHRARPGARDQRAGRRAALDRAGRLRRPRPRRAGRPRARHAAVEGRQDPQAAAGLAAGEPVGRAAGRRAVADADVKGGAADQQYAVERALLAVVQARGSGR